MKLKKPVALVARTTNLQYMMHHALMVMKDLSELVHTEKWQGIDISNKPEMATYEYRHFHSRAILNGTDLGLYRSIVAPNLPWADDHFEERVCGEPINPGVQWAKWPYAHSADRFRAEGGKFNHNYMERYWPRYAGMTEDGKLGNVVELENLKAHRGIYHEYGDLLDVVLQLNREPLTRQAILPVWFPEDTGVAHGGRVPCSIFYHFLMRDDRMDVTYYLRSCDLMRHFRDDVYLTIRLLLWVIGQLRAMDPKWANVEPGELILDIGSLHLFKNDYMTVFGETRD